MAVTEKDITLCGHGSGTPSTKNMYTYLESRYKSIAPNGKHKGVIAVRRLKKITDSGRKKFHDTYKTILGRNSYNQSLRSYVYAPYKGKYYSDCSSSGCATFKKIGYSVPLLNTAGIYTSSLFETVPVKIENGHITNPEILKVGDAILFVGSDPSRPKQIGHVEFIYTITSTAKKPTLNKENSSYYPKCASKCTTISSALDSIKVDSSKAHRTKIAKANGIDGYVGSSDQNTLLLSLLKAGKLKRV